VACVVSYDPHERAWNPPMPLLFQRRIGMDHRAIPSGTIRDWICQSLPTGPEDTGIADTGHWSTLLRAGAERVLVVGTRREPG
jgi:hypothetical protein